MCAPLPLGLHHQGPEVQGAPTISGNLDSMDHQSLVKLTTLP